MPCRSEAKTRRGGPKSGRACARRGHTHVVRSCPRTWAWHPLQVVGQEFPPHPQEEFQKTHEKRWSKMITYCKIIAYVFGQPQNRVLMASQWVQVASNGFARGFQSRSGGFPTGSNRFQSRPDGRVLAGQIKVLAGWIRVLRWF